MEIQHSSSDKATVTKVFSQTVNEKLGRGDDGSKRPLLGKPYEANPSGDGKKNMFICEHCNVIVESEEKLKTHVTDKHPTAMLPIGSKKQKVAVIPLVCIDIRNSLLSAPVFIKDQGSYIVDCNRDGVYARLKYYPKFVVKADSDKYLKALNDASPNKLGWQQRQTLNRKTGKERGEPRLTCYYGPTYEYAGVKWDENREWPEELLELKNSVEAATGLTFNSVLGTLYRNGYDSIGWHSDDEPELGKYPTIASLSFGATRAFEMCKVINQYQQACMSIHLCHGDLMVTEGSFQERWKHCVFKAPQIRDRRVNFTFRTIDPSLRKKRANKAEKEKPVSADKKTEKSSATGEKSESADASKPNPTPSEVSSENGTK